jgi:hypothetical protein
MARGTEGLCPLGRQKAAAQSARLVSAATFERSNDSNTHEATNGEGWIEHTQSGTGEERSKQNRRLYHQSKGRKGCGAEARLSV